MSQISRRRRPTLRGWFATRLALAGLMVAASFVLMAGPAQADCPVTDLTCLPETVADPVTTIADATTEVAAAATGTVDQAAAAAEETAAAVTDPVSQVVEPVTDAVKGIVGQTPDPPDPGPIDDPTGLVPDVLGTQPTGPDATGLLPGVLGSTVTEPSGPGATGPGGNGSANGPSSAKSRTAGGTGPSFLGRGPVVGPVPGPISSTPAVSMAIPQQALFERVGSLTVEAAQALAFPLALAVIVLLFAAVQNRIDRKDPKLALAPIAPDLLRFE
jgi:hypothetical protein